MQIEDTSLHPSRLAPNSMMPSFQGLKDKLSSGSFTLRPRSQRDVTLSSADQAQKDQLRAVVKAFKLRDLAELKVPLWYLGSSKQQVSG